MKQIFKCLALASLLMMTACGIFSRSSSSDYRKLLPDEIYGQPEQILTKKGYTVSYNSETRLPNWVFWRLTREHTESVVAKHGDSFREDTKVPKPRATNADYRRTDFVRAQMCPADDNRWNAAAMRDAFLYTNVGPQTERCNSVWNTIEVMCREWAKEYHELYVVSGPILNKSSKTIGPNDVAVPYAYFKVVVCLDGKKKGIGFICDNEDYKQIMKQCVFSIDEVERITGIHFFPNLSAKERRDIKEKADLKDW